MFGVEEVGTLEDHTAMRELVKRFKRFMRSVACVLWNGNHELYRAHTKHRMFQKCHSCGYETKGWDLSK